MNRQFKLLLDGFKLQKTNILFLKNIINRSKVNSCSTEAHVFIKQPSFFQKIVLETSRILVYPILNKIKVGSSFEQFSKEPLCLKCAPNFCFMTMLHFNGPRNTFFSEIYKRMVQLLPQLCSFCFFLFFIFKFQLLVH